MRNAGRRIANAFGFIDDVFDELRRGDGVRWGESVLETIDDAIRTYKSEVEKMNEKVARIDREYTVKK